MLFLGDSSEKYYHAKSDNLTEGISKIMNAILRHINENDVINKLGGVYSVTQECKQLQTAVSRVINAAYQTGILPEGDHYPEDLLRIIEQYFLSRGEYRTLQNKYREGFKF